ncbi:ABC transporter C family member 10 [Quillaja saponaria]|uniref:ABC-type xenobiotic transporter n=1 Tax=Quillaja saponaria TaxID=32244 RepID=A0AAD7Q3R2_QUISA|nr:ABC transporter C family member 10 [Quillaja saponaria]
MHDLQIRYRPDSPLVLCGITCTVKGGDKIGIVGRTGSGKSTLIGALFRLVEPVGRKIIVAGIDISTIGLHDLRSGNMGGYWEVSAERGCSRERKGLRLLVVDDCLNWSMGQRQLFCLGRALLRRNRILVLDEATTSIDNATDLILQKTFRSEFSDCTVITAAHRIPTVMDYTKVLAISDGKLVEYNEPMNLIKREGSLFRRLVQEFWSHFQSAESH